MQIRLLPLSIDLSDDGGPLVCPDAIWMLPPKDTACDGGIRWGDELIIDDFLHIEHRGVNRDLSEAVPATLSVPVPSNRPGEWTPPVLAKPLQRVYLREVEGPAKADAVLLLLSVARGKLCLRDGHKLQPLAYLPLGGFDDDNGNNVCDGYYHEFAGYPGMLALLLRVGSDYQGVELDPPAIVDVVQQFSPGVDYYRGSFYTEYTDHGRIRYYVPREA